MPLNEYFIEQKAQDEAQDEAIEIKITVNIDNFNNTELRLIEMLKDSNMSKKDIAIVLGYKSISGNLKKAIDNLLKQGLIEYTIPEKLRSKNQKYKLTKLGATIRR